MLKKLSIFFILIISLFSAMSAGSASCLPLGTGVLMQSTPWGRRQDFVGVGDESGLFLGVGPSGFCRARL